MRAVAVLLAACTIAVPLAAGSADRAQARFRLFASGLKGAWWLGAPQSEPLRLYVVQKGGQIRVLVDGRVQQRPFLDIGDLVGSPGPEQGLLSMAFHPRYALNHRFYVAYTDNHGDLRVVEYRSTRLRFRGSRLRRLLLVRQPSPRNGGGQLQFGPDGLLYMGLGDGGPVGRPGNRSQDFATKLGKLLRIDVDRRGAHWQIVGYGLRYPWRFSFDRATGGLLLADRGEKWEEVDVWPRRELGRLANYGWPHYDGLVEHNPTPLNPSGELVFPIAVHPHREGRPREACLITGGYVYRGSAVPAMRGRYVYGDAYTNELWSLRLSGGKATDLRREPVEIQGVSTFGEDARGELYAAAPRQGRIYKLAR